MLAILEPSWHARDTLYMWWFGSGLGRNGVNHLMYARCCGGKLGPNSCPAAAAPRVNTTQTCTTQKANKYHAYQNNSSQYVRLYILCIPFPSRSTSTRTVSNHPGTHWPLLSFLLSWMWMLSTTALSSPRVNLMWWYVETWTNSKFMLSALCSLCIRFNWGFHHCAVNRAIASRKKLVP